MSVVASGEMSPDIDWFSVSNELRCAQSVATAGCKKLREYTKLMDCDDEIDENYKVMLICLLHGETRSKSGDKRKSRNYDDGCSVGALIDPQYGSFLNHLKEHGESYVLQCERDGSVVVYGYEDNIHLEEECNPESRRSSRDERQQGATSNQTGDVGNQCDQGQRGDLVEKTSKRTQKILIHENDKVEKTKCSPKDKIQVKESSTFHKSATVKDKPNDLTVNCNTAANEKICGFNSSNKGRKRKFSRALVPEMECSVQMPDGKNQHKHNAQQTSVEKVNDVILKKSPTNQGKMAEDVRSSSKHMAPFQEIECADKMLHGENPCKHNPRQTSVEKVNDVIPKRPSTSRPKISGDVRSSLKRMAPYQEIECADQMPHEENHRKHSPRQTSVKVNGVIPRKPSKSQAKTSEDIESTPNCMVPVQVTKCSDHMSGRENQAKHNPQRTSAEKVNDVIPRKPSTNQDKMSEDVRCSSKLMPLFQGIECAEQMSHGENQRKHNSGQVSGHKISDVISRKPSMDGAKMSANVSSPCNRRMLVPENLHRHQSVEHGGDFTARNLNVCNIENNIVNSVGVSHRIQRQSELGSIVDQRIDLMPTADNQCNHDSPLAADKTRNDNDKVQKITGIPTNKVTMAKTYSKTVRLGNYINVPNLHTMVNQDKHRLDSRKKQNTQELRGDAKLKVGLSNETSGAKTRHGHDLRPTSAIKSKSSTMRSRNKAQKDDIVKCSYDEFISVRPAERSMKMGSEDEMASNAKIFDNKKPAAERSMGMESEKEMTSDVKILDDKKSAAVLARDEFRKQVLDFLRRPFDKEEYSRYQEAARAGSYYSYYGDIVSKLKKCRHNPKKRMTIFRTFFFWLENLSHPGAFKPWKESECLAVEPGSA